uniref:CDP-diacylglycerol--glycerol-3-phosphate 3-phosphatidyltransferase n=1 Tax=Macrostomum lignano TaxID=282301 RepID=A0A1I8F5K9_9PLAT
RHRLAPGRPNRLGVPLPRLRALTSVASSSRCPASTMVSAAGRRLGHRPFQRPLRVASSCLDCGARGTRGSPLNSSTAMLRPLCAGAERPLPCVTSGATAQMFRVSFYRCPVCWPALLPERINEVVGCSTMKIYLARDYFTDRPGSLPVLIRDAPRLCDFLEKLVSTACRRVGTAGLGRLLSSQRRPRLASAGGSVESRDSSRLCHGADGAHGSVCDDAYATQRLLQPAASAGGRLASIQLASAGANSFYKSTGPSYFIPAAYSQSAGAAVSCRPLRSLRRTGGSRSGGSPVSGCRVTRGPAGPSTPKACGSRRPRRPAGRPDPSSARPTSATGRGCAIWKSQVRRWPPTSDRLGCPPGRGGGTACSSTASPSSMGNVECGGVGEHRPLACRLAMPALRDLLHSVGTGLNRQSR